MTFAFQVRKKRNLIRIHWSISTINKLIEQRSSYPTLKKIIHQQRNIRKDIKYQLNNYLVEFVILETTLFH